MVIVQRAAQPVHIAQRHTGDSMDHANNVRAEASGRKGRTVITAKGGAEAMLKGAGHDIVSAVNSSVGGVTMST